jgi:ribosomal protein S18 acetylase RimI-like enzyme
MPIDINQEPVDALANYAAIPISFWVRARLRVEWIERGLGGIRLTEEPVEPAYFKDYDAIPGETPLAWPRRWDISKWGILMARDGGAAVGGAVVAWATPGITMLEGRDDLAVLWDIRVKPERRRQGVGEQLMTAAATWARQRQCRKLKIETQNTNVPACRFYAACGCRLGAVHPGAYAEFPEEVMLFWYLDLR